MKQHLAAFAALSFFLLPGFAMAETTEAKQPLMTVTGRATLEAAPDFASISIGVTNKAPTTAGAIDATSAAAGKIATSAIAFGIAPRDIQTSYVTLQPAYKNVRDPGGGMEQRPDGYVASNSVVVRVRDLGKLGGFLRSVVDGGANQIGGISFELADPGKLEREALAAAVKDARRQAEVVAGAADIRIERIESINTGGSYRPMPRPAPMAARAARADVPIQAGSLEVSSEVQMTFSFGPAQ